MRSVGKESSSESRYTQNARVKLSERFKKESHLVTERRLKEVTQLLQAQHSPSKMRSLKTRVSRHAAPIKDKIVQQMFRSLEQEAKHAGKSSFRASAN